MQNSILSVLSKKKERTIVKFGLSARSSYVRCIKLSCSIPACAGSRLSQNSLVHDRCEYCNQKPSTIKLAGRIQDQKCLQIYPMRIIDLFTTPEARIPVAGLVLSMSQFVTLYCRHSLSLIRNGQGSINEEILVQDLTRGKGNYLKGYSMCEVIGMYENFPS